jgi:16S rRNA processing protein RimM
MQNDLLKLGEIVSVKGIKGEVKIASTSDYLAYRFQKGKEVNLARDNDSKKMVVMMSHLEKNAAIVLFEGISSRNEAEMLCGYSVYCDKTDRPPLEDNHYYVDDLIGVKVENTLGEVMGVVKDVISLPASDVFEIEDKGKTYLVPFVPAIVKKVGKDKIIIEEIEGLR